MIITFTNLKGGVAKTTSTVNIGGVLAREGYDVLLIDADPQASLTNWFDYSPRFTLVDLLTGAEEIQEVVDATRYESLDLIPARRTLAKLLSEPPKKVGRRLKRILSPAAGVYDYILIDSPPSLGTFSMAAVSACDRILAPVEASVAAVDGLADTIDMASDLGKPPAEWLGAFVTQVDMRTNNDQEVQPYLVDKFPGHVFDTVIRATVRVRESNNQRVPTVYHDASCTASQDYADLTNEILSYVRARSTK